ncbi:Antirestriction protein KlcA [compost metagenome]
MQDYQGGYWNFYTLSNGGFFAALDTDKEQHVVIADNYCSERMSAEAAGVTLMLFVLGRLLAARIPENESDRFIDLYHKLREFALEHAEAQAILTAID